jgi:phage baseplate assembly protein W
MEHTFMAETPKWDVRVARRDRPLVKRIIDLLHVDQDHFRPQLESWLGMRYATEPLRPPPSAPAGDEVRLDHKLDAVVERLDWFEHSVRDLLQTPQSPTSVQVVVERLDQLEHAVRDLLQTPQSSTSAQVVAERLDRLERSMSNLLQTPQYSLTANAQAVAERFALEQSLGRLLQPLQSLLLASGQDVAARLDRLEQSLRRLPRLLPSSSKAKGTRKPASTRRVAVGDRSPQRELAEQLVKETIPDDKGGRRVLRTAEIEQRLITTLHIPRQSAMSAARKAVQALDPDNDARRTHRRPIAREVTPKMIRRMRALRKSGMQRRQIAEALGCDPRTVTRHLK